MAETHINVPVIAPSAVKMKTHSSVDMWGDTVQTETALLVDSNGVEIGPATEATQSAVLASLQALNALVPAIYDFVSLGYTGTDLTTVVYKLGGAGGTVVSTITLGYTGGLLTSVAKT